VAGAVEYLELIVDVFDNTGQRARVKKTLTAGELVGEVLREFDDLDQKTPEAYALFLRGEEKPLERGLNMEQLNIQDHDELVFKHAMHKGAAKQDLTAIVRYIERDAGFEIPKTR
jgi:hypothetical protein